jgi:hypothetical protein
MDQDRETIEARTGSAAPAVFGLFPASAALDAAIKDLEAAGFDRADLSLPDIDPPLDRDTPELGAKEADTDVEAQQSRLMHAGTGGAIGAMLAAAATAATGGAAAAVAGAAVGAGLVVGGVAHVVSRAASGEEQADRDRKAAAGRLVLSVRTPDAAREARAREILRLTGATRVW